MASRPIGMNMFAYSPMEIALCKGVGGYVRSSCKLSDLCVFGVID